MSNTHHHLLLLLSLLLPSLALAFRRPETTPTPLDVIIEGTVRCQSCAYIGSWSLTSSKPISSAKVGIACKDHKNRVRFYQSFKTDNNGYFYAPLKGLVVKDVVKACSVKLLASADQGCNVLTNVNYGIGGASLRFEKRLLLGGKSYAVYAAGPLAFRPATCAPVVHK
ncbi:hypothetical protein QJS04_geneDACA010639 [Acorus gramineus]|uniref:Non-classical arabinogalactan protein 30 n=1 Tax=Acorus gramineus TaxID=55184 RepID=A0AAV9AL31_ACOGR|nr:hypothetical protein QJS04_geneDACA010639 [Acorus gramineus]